MVCWFANSFYQRSFLHTTVSRDRSTHFDRGRTYIFQREPGSEREVSVVTVSCSETKWAAH